MAKFQILSNATTEEAQTPMLHNTNTVMRNDINRYHRSTAIGRKPWTFRNDQWFPAENACRPPPPPPPPPPTHTHTHTHPPPAFSLSLYIYTKCKQ